MISLIAAMDRNGLIGAKGNIPWKIKEDSQRFRDITLGKPVIMGRKTYESIGKALDKRTNIILTRNASYKAKKCAIAGSIDEALAIVSNVYETMIIGGAEIYKLFLPKAEKLYLTTVLAEFKGDAYFPEIKLKDWQLVRAKYCQSPGKNVPPQTFRPISPGAERWLGRPIKCLDSGFVYLVDYAGNDESIAQAARVSYGSGTSKASTNRGLIRYLRRHIHTTPFEMVEFKFHCKMPIFVARQWIRHRTANVNEYSGRYSVMSDEFYLPDSAILAKQAQGNKQGRDDVLAPEQGRRVLDLLKEDYQRSLEHYQEFLEMDLARELARIGLSIANYTQWYWKIDLHNLMHFLSLRMDEHAQYEIRVFANAMARIVQDAVPICYQAFEDYQLNAMRLSSLEVQIVNEHSWPMSREEAERIALELFNNKRETQEFLEKLAELKFLTNYPSDQGHNSSIRGDNLL